MGSTVASGEVRPAAGGLAWNELLEHPHHFESSREFADAGVLCAPHASSQTTVLRARYVHDEFHWQCRPLLLA